ncbi:APC family permease [Actinophytocola sp.]|uniref:APC family permease n=1 Tax=Actinophytocola sp. TaxID=1872138 RepID=UPI003899CDCE
MSAVVYFVMSAATPLTVVAGVVTTGFAVTGIIGLPIAFIVIGAILALFCVGYVSMARDVAYAGAFYTYLARGLGRPIGVSGAWVALVGYTALQVGLYGAIGPAATPLLQAWFGIEVPWWVVALCAWAIVAGLGLQRIDVNGRVLAVLLLAEIGVILLYDLTNLTNPAGGTLRFDTLNPAALAAPGAGAILALAVLGFIGFEGAVVYSEEARDPHRTVKVASYVAVGVITGLYTLSSWAMSVATGPDAIVAQSQTLSTELIFQLAGSHLGAAFVDIGHVLFVTSVLAAAISFHNTTTRYIFALGREGVLPEVFGRVRPKTGAPKFGSLCQSATGLAVIVLYAVAGWDPVVHLFYWLGTTGGFGILLLIAATSIAILAYLLRNPRWDTIWHRIIAPFVASILLLGVITLAIANFDMLLGVEPTSPLRWGIPTAFFGIAVGGVIWALVCRRRRPEIYENIGLAAKSATTGASRSTGEGDPAAAVPMTPDFGWDPDR